MIYAIGLDTDKTYVSFLRRAKASSLELVAVNLRAMALEPWSFAVPATSGRTIVYGTGSATTALDPFASFYVRLIDLTPALPPAEGEGWRNMLLALYTFLETAPGRVVNRPGAQVHNGSKPLHGVVLMNLGFAVPPAIVSSNGDVLRAFVLEHGECVVKALCGARGIARKVRAEEFVDFDPQRGPVYLQRMIRGADVRAHVIHHDVHAEMINSDAIDYREDAARATYAAHVLPSDLSHKLVRATADLGLVFAGWDFKIDDSGTYWCLEANPMPGYDVYDARASGAITKSLLRYLGHASPD